MKRNTDTGSHRPRGWTPDASNGGRVVVRNADGSVVIAYMALVPANGGGRFATIRYEHSLARSILDSAPLDAAFWQWLEDWANDRRNFVVILGWLNRPDPEGGAPISMRLFPEDAPDAVKRGRKPDSFYVRLAAFVRACVDHDIAYGPRLARENGVSEGTVRSWVHEARRRGYLEERA